MALIKRSWDYLFLMFCVLLLVVTVIVRVPASFGTVSVPLGSAPPLDSAASASAAAVPSSYSTANRPPILTAQANTAQWQRAWSTDFSVAVPLGQFPGAVGSQWGAYPNPWPDTASQRNYAVHGYYDPATTVWINGGYMHIRMWRATGNIHSAAVYPKVAQGVMYGRFVEVTRVSKVTQGYKSAHLLWPVNNANNFEVDFPENEWTTSPSVYVHYGQDESTVSFDTHLNWSAWHTYEMRWQPGLLSFYVDGKLIGRTSQGVPNVNMSWIIQNESALFGPSAPVNSSAQMDISYVAYDKYVG